MINNDVFRNISQLLEFNDSTLAEIFKLSGYQIDQATIAGFLKKADEAGYIDCNNSLMTYFLDGLITYRRGKTENNPARQNPAQPLLSNNHILKKLRIAFDLKEDDLIELMAIANFDITRNEISALFRKEGHKHFRECSDDILMAFIHGLTFRKRAR